MPFPIVSLPLREVEYDRPPQIIFIFRSKFFTFFFLSVLGCKVNSIVRKFVRI